MFKYLNDVSAQQTIINKIENAEMAQIYTIFYQWYFGLLSANATEDFQELMNTAVIKDS